MNGQQYQFRLTKLQISTVDCSARGYTLIELMITIAIVSIITMVSVPLYQNYSLRARVGGDLLLVNPVKKLVVEEYLVNNSWPTSNSEAEAYEPSTYSGSFVKSVEVTNNPVDGSIVITYDTDALPVLTGKNTIVFYPDVNARSIEWHCDSGTMKNKYRPAQCRGGS